MYYSNAKLNFEISKVDDKMHSMYGWYFWCISGCGGSCGFITTETARYIINKLQSLYHNESWYNSDNLIWNLFEHLPH